MARPMANNSLVLQVTPSSVIPAQAGIQPLSVIPAQVEIQQPALNSSTLLDSRFRGNDGIK